MEVEVVCSRSKAQQSLCQKSAKVSGRYTATLKTYTLQQPAIASAVGEQLQIAASRCAKAADGVGAAEPAARRAVGAAQGEAAEAFPEALAIGAGTAYPRSIVWLTNGNTLQLSARDGAVLAGSYLVGRALGASLVGVGLTGGIATGKSTVSKAFREAGAVIVDADVVAREVVMPGCGAYKEIVSYFGTGRPREEEETQRCHPQVHHLGDVQAARVPALGLPQATCGVRRTTAVRDQAARVLLLPDDRSGVFRDKRTCTAHETGQYETGGRREAHQVANEAACTCIARAHTKYGAVFLIHVVACAGKGGESGPGDRK
ncbi:hypothetical protein ON010_g11853 [Phytophthora cinnamomi]|nr:hypothetical protein ON010_g11853 [Phytophthora cinnamomi]